IDPTVEAAQAIVQFLDTELFDHDPILSDALSAMMECHHRGLSVAGIGPVGGCWAPFCNTDMRRARPWPPTGQSNRNPSHFIKLLFTLQRRIPYRPCVRNGLAMRS